jgi:ribosomal subunit interface protein
MRRPPRKSNGTARSSAESPSRCGIASSPPVDGRSGAGISAAAQDKEHHIVEVRVAGHQVDTGESLRQEAQRRVSEITQKYFARATGATVTFGRGSNHDFSCDIVAPVAQGLVLKASHSAPKADLALSGAADRIERQLRRYSNRLHDHKGQDHSAPFVENAGYTVFRSADPVEGEVEGDFPAIVAETKVDIPDASVSDAVMLMDLRNTNALMFRNSATGAFNMIYRREDGHIGWVEPDRG